MKKAIIYLAIFLGTCWVASQLLQFVSDMLGDLGFSATLKDDAVWFFVGVGLGMKISLCLPVCIDPILNGGRIIGLGHFVNALCAFFTHLF